MLPPLRTSSCYGFNNSETNSPVVHSRRGSYDTDGSCEYTEFSSTDSTEPDAKTYPPPSKRHKTVSKGKHVAVGKETAEAEEDAFLKEDKATRERKNRTAVTSGLKKLEALLVEAGISFAGELSKHNKDNCVLLYPKMEILERTRTYVVELQQQVKELRGNVPKLQNEDERRPE